MEESSEIVFRIESTLIRIHTSPHYYPGGDGIRTHEPLKDGITHVDLPTHVFYITYLDLESCAFDRASLPLHDMIPVRFLISCLLFVFI